MFFFLCSSPEDEPWHPWLGTAAKAGKGKAQMQTRPPSTNHTGQRLNKTTWMCCPKTLACLVINQ